MSLARCSLNAATIRHADLETAIRATLDAGIPSIGVWREPVQSAGLSRAAALLRASGLRVSSLCRGGFVTAIEGPERRAAIDDNRRAIEEAAAVGAPVLVLVVGGLPPGSRDLTGARARVGEAIAELVPEARAAGVALGLEPLHPMFAADRSVVSTLAQALDLVAPFPPATAGVVIDTSHVWWDPSLPAQIARAGAERRILGYQVADWVTPLTPDVLVSRGMPGDGWIDLAQITALVDAAGYTADIEYEIFREEVWAQDPSAVARAIAARHEQLIAPALAGAR